MLNEAERQELAERLAGKSLKAARREVRRLDRDANLKIWRTSVSNEIHTTYELPNLGVRVILIEDTDTKPIPDSQLVRREFVYAEARVEPWTPPSG